MREVVVVSAARTPFGRFGGTLKDVTAIDLGAHVMREVVDRIKIASNLIEEISMGICITAENKDPAGPVIAKQMSLKAGFPTTIPTSDIERGCCASAAAMQLGNRAIRAGSCDVFLAGGAERMSGTPLIVRETRWGRKLGNLVMEDPIFNIGYKGFEPVAKEVGELALQYGIDRKEQDEWAYLSHQKADKAWAEQKFTQEVTPYLLKKKNGETVLFSTDESVRKDTTMEKLSQLRTVYGSPTVTPGNAPGLNDGASAMVMMTKEKSLSLGVKTLATIVNTTAVATEPHKMGLAPSLAILKALATAGLSVKDLDLIEINEAFAAVPLTSLKVMANQDEDFYKKLKAITNVNGGAVAIGHPVGASGVRITMTLIYELMRRGGGIGAAAICGGLGHGDAVIVKVG